MPSLSLVQGSGGDGGAAGAGGLLLLEPVRLPEENGASSGPAGIR
ncbi:MAG TPA: hypothetical protein VE842_01110 [Pyrinomonadaceae bacterium]|nr:hypothetical protein [Pyrinomonadaceae bacterium]